MYICIYVGPPILLVPPQNTVVQVGSTAKLSCLFLAHPNDGGIYWQKRYGNSHKVIHMHHILPNGTLIITRTTCANSGEYLCIVYNSNGQTTGTANLIVISKSLASYTVFSVIYCIPKTMES